jgi:glycosidase
LRVPWNMKPIIYQLVVRYFGNTNLTNETNGSIYSNGCGKFGDINEAALAGLKELGVTHIWLTGVFTQATLTDYSNIGMPADDPDVVKGLAGSFYAVRDYYDVSPDYAYTPTNRMQEFEGLVERIHKAQMQVLIDLVANHVSRAYSSNHNSDISLGRRDDTNQFFLPGNEFFYLVNPPGQALQLTKPDNWSPPGVVFDGRFGPEDGSPGRPPKATGNNVTSPAPASTDWYETIKLNYGFNFASRQGCYDPQPRLWSSMDAILAFWQDKGVDGFRCDFAHYVPTEAWGFLIDRARQRRPAYFFAEAYPGIGSGDPVEQLQELIDAGFDAVYHYQSYNALKNVYRFGRLDEYDHEMVSQPDSIRKHFVHYLENHDERRIPSPIVISGSTGDSGFGSADASYQLAPLQFLYSSGAALLFNGQEIGEPGEGVEGFGGEDGRTTIYDYWTMSTFAEWVNGHRYDGAGLHPSQLALRNFYSALGKLCQDPAVTGDGFWGLRYFNNELRFPDCPAMLYSFARFQSGSGRALLIAANFQMGTAANGRVRLPSDLTCAAGLTGTVNINLILDRNGSRNSPVVSMDVEQLKAIGFPISIPNQTSQVYSISQH